MSKKSLFLTCFISLSARRRRAKLLGSVISRLTPESRQLNMRKPHGQEERFHGFMRLTFRLSWSVRQFSFLHHNHLDPFWSDSYSPTLGADGKTLKR